MTVIQVIEKVSSRAQNTQQKRPNVALRCCILKDGKVIKAGDKIAKVALMPLPLSSTKAQILSLSRTCDY